eukprot:scaffold54245_cov24-Phaeocystis_antarctica.AAC.1
MANPGHNPNPNQVRDLIIRRDYGGGARMGVGSIHHRERKTYVGDLSVFGDAVASATVVAGTKCVCLVLHHSQAAAVASLMPYPYPYP